VTVFVSTGTTGFDDLAKAMDRLAAGLPEPVIIQVGEGRYIPQNAEHFGLAPSLDPFVQAASLVVAHGGLGICMEALEAGKRLVAVNNPDRYDNHQVDLLTALEAAGYLIYCRRLEDLPDAVERAMTTDFRPYQKSETTIHLRIREFLAGLSTRRTKRTSL